jgi:hypothetical protein
MRAPLKASVTAVALLVPASASAQRLTPPFPTASFAASSALFGADSANARKIPRTYWLEGGLIAGTGLGVLSALWCRGMSEEPRTNVAGTIGCFVLGGTVGFTAGALIGGQFRKPGHTSQ